jgi:hypothetical protein
MPGYELDSNIYDRVDNELRKLQITDVCDKEFNTWVLNYWCPSVNSLFKEVYSDTFEDLFSNASFFGVSRLSIPPKKNKKKKK